MAKVHTMKRFCSVVSVALLLSATMGCTDRATQNRHLSATEEAQLLAQAQAEDAEAARKLERLQKARDAKPENDLAIAPDIRDGWQWSEEEIAMLKKRAKSGDMKAADRLHQYYSVHEDKANMAYWDEWLFTRGDRGAIQNRALSLYSASKERRLGDPSKLAELKEAERLERSVTDNLADNPFLEKLKSEIAFIEGSR
jgi:hypothetical protein